MSLSRRVLQQEGDHQGYPVIVFEGRRSNRRRKYYQGSKVDENYAVVDKINGGNFTQRGFPYDPRMDQCALQLRAEIKCPKGKAKEFVLVNLNTGPSPPRRRLPCWPATTPLPKPPSPRNSV